MKHLTVHLLKNHGFKVIAVTEELLSNTEFRALKERYESSFNAKLHELVAKNGVGKRTDR